MWLEVQIAAHRLDAEAVAAALEPHADGGVVTEEPINYPPGQETFAIDYDALLTVKAYFSESAAQGWPALRRRLRRLFSTQPLTIRSRRFSEEDWAYSWREYFPVLHIGRRLVVQPTWRDYDSHEDEIVLHLDPGLAFGTGQHPTTRLCLEALEGTVKPAFRILDVGTGSGILAIAAAKLGAASVLGLDIEPQAVQATRENAQLNGVADIVQAVEGSLSGTPATQSPDSGYDLVVANISALAICDLATELARALRDGGTLIASGFIAENEGAVARSLREAGLAIDRTVSDGDWRAIFASKATKSRA